MSFGVVPIRSLHGILAVCGILGCEVVVAALSHRVLAHQGRRSESIDFHNRGYPRIGIDLIGSEQWLISICSNNIHIYKPGTEIACALLSYNVRLCGTKQSSHGKPLACGLVERSSSFNEKCQRSHFAGVRVTISRDLLTSQHPPTGTMTTSVVVFESTAGTFKAELFVDKMPITCGNMIDLVEQHHFYDGLYIHRIAPEFCIQLGCPFSNAEPPHVMYGTLHENAGQGSGPPETTFLEACGSSGSAGKEHSRDEYGNIEDELVKDTDELSNRKYTLSMANSGDPDSGGSQFFINIKDNQHLDWWNGASESAHPVFGKIVGEESMKVIDKIAAVETDAEQPVNPIRIISVKVESRWIHKY